MPLNSVIYNRKLKGNYLKDLNTLKDILHKCVLSVQNDFFVLKFKKAVDFFRQPLKLL